MGSITKAADTLRVAQPALSQQLAGLEEHFRQKLLTRSQQGVVMTDAGKIVYRHAQAILRQMEQAQAEVLNSAGSLSGRVSVGLVPFSGATTLALPLLEETKRQYPGILLHITESVSQPYSQMIINGRLEMAMIHGGGPIRGVRFEPLQREEFVFIAHKSLGVSAAESPVSVGDLASLPFLLPPPYNFVRRAVEMAFRRSRSDLVVVAELESLKMISLALTAGIGATILPQAIGQRIKAEIGDDIVLRQIASPTVDETLSLCI